MSVNTSYELNSIDARTTITFHGMSASSQVRARSAAAVSLLRTRNAAIPREYAAHMNNTNNPHEVTCEQIGAEPVGSASSSVGSHNTDMQAHENIMPNKIGNQVILGLFN